jgi:hypothetical protein
MMILGSLVLVFASIAIFAEVYASTDHETAVLIVARSIQQGQELTGSELGQANVTISGGVNTIPVVDASELEGKRAAVTIPAGSLLTIGDVASSQPIGLGEAIVGMALKPGQLPAAGVASGDQVMIVQTGGADSLAVPASSNSSAVDSGSETGVLVSQATVFDVEVPPANSESATSQLVSVEVPQSIAASVSAIAAANQASLVVLPTDMSAGDPRATGSSSSNEGGSSPAHKRGKGSKVS